MRSAAQRLCSTCRHARLAAGTCAHPWPPDELKPDLAVLAAAAPPPPPAPGSVITTTSSLRAPVTSDRSEAHAQITHQHCKFQPQQFQVSSLSLAGTAQQQHNLRGTGDPRVPGFARRAATLLLLRRLAAIATLEEFLGLRFASTWARTGCQIECAAQRRMSCRIDEATVCRSATVTQYRDSPAVAAIGRMVSCRRSRACMPCRGKLPASWLKLRRLIQKFDGAMSLGALAPQPLTSCTCILPTCLRTRSMPVRGRQTWNGRASPHVHCLYFWMKTRKDTSKTESNCCASVRLHRLWRQCGDSSETMSEMCTGWSVVHVLQWSSNQQGASRFYPLC